MVKRKIPKTLKQICFEAIPELITTHIKKLVLRSEASGWFFKLYGQCDVTQEDILNQQIASFRDFIYSQVIWYDYESIFVILLTSVDEAVSSARQKWDVTTEDLSSYRQEVEAMSKFSDLVACPRMRRLDFGLVPKSLRTRVVDLLGSFTYLKVLVLDGGQWLFKNVAHKLTEGLDKLHFLEEFSLKQDCTNVMLKVLANRCNGTLMKLDIENSKHVDDSSLPVILSCNKLQEVNLFKSGLSEESLARIIMGLPNLQSLPRGDFLCDALGWIDYLEEMENPKFALKELFPSQTYYFHEAWQLEMAAQMCPLISKILFIYHESCVPNYLVLLHFQNLSEVEFYGGGFYSDKILDFLQIRGNQLKKLNLISIKQVDYRCIANISVLCPQLLCLSFNHCDMIEFKPKGDPNSDEEYDRRQAFLMMAREAFEQMQRLVRIETLGILSTCPTIHLRMLLSHCPNVKQIHLGCNTAIDDELMAKVFSRNPLLKLEEFHCDKAGPNLGIDSFNLLLDRCESLKALGDLQNWRGIDPMDIGRLREMAREQNFDLDLRSHQKIRKFVEMRDFERKTYINLVSGPSMERIRMAERHVHDAMVEH